MSTARRQSSSDWPGTPNIRSIEHVVEARRPRRAQAGRPGGRVVVAAEAPQQLVVEGLHANREPVDAVAAQRAQVGFVGLARVDLDGDLQRARVGGTANAARAASITRPSASGRHRPGVPPPK